MKPTHLVVANNRVFTFGDKDFVYRQLAQARGVSIGEVFEVYALTPIETYRAFSYKGVTYVSSDLKIPLARR